MKRKWPFTNHSLCETERSRKEEHSPTAERGRKVEHSHKAGQSRKPTVGTMFAKELANLIQLIESTQSHFIRCAAPDSTASASPRAPPAPSPTKPLA